MLEKNGTKIVVAKDAIVYWTPRKTIKEAFIMFFRFALGDAESGILRVKALFILARYGIGASLLISGIILKSQKVLYTVFFFFILYIIWAISKNYRYVKKWQAYFILPLLQIVSDIAVITGTIFGLYKQIWVIRRIQSKGFLGSGD